jgi:hypothetical protein
MKKKTVKWYVTFTNDITNKINSTVKHVHKYAKEKTSSIYAKGIIYGGYYSEIQKRQIIWWHDICTNKIILSVISSIIFNLWLDNRPSYPPSMYHSLLSIFFFIKQPPPPPNINTIQPSTINSTTTTLSLSIFIF